MVLHLAEQLEVPLRERNQLLLAAGYAPVYGERPLDDAGDEPVREAIELMLAGHEPYPAAVVDRGGTSSPPTAASRCSPRASRRTLLEPPVNVLRVTLHPDGHGAADRQPREWRAHLLDRLRRQARVTGDPALAALLRRS